MSPPGTVSWDLAESILDSTSSACRENLEDVLEQPAAILSPACRAEIGRILERKSDNGDDSKPRRGGGKSGAQDDTATTSGTGSKHDISNADGTHTATIVLSFISCVLVAVVGLAYFLRGGRKRPTRGGKRLHKKKQDRIRERGKKRR
ncbi:unnamed protein product [Hapterophycus canaliculatus]